MIDKIVCIIVLYNVTLSDSVTYKSISKINDVYKLLVVDNSDFEFGNFDFCKKNGYQYLNMGGNKGLSRAYNCALDNCEDCDVVVLLDDDTELTGEYFNILRIALQNNNGIDIFAPIVYGQDGVIYSPNEFYFLKNHYIKSINDNIDDEKFNAISSALAIRKKVFDNYRFDERLFLDQVDQYFFYEQHKIGIKCAKLNVIIHQNFFQRGENLNSKIVWNRLKYRIPDIFMHAKLMRNVKYIFLAIIKSVGIGMNLCIKTKDIRLLFNVIACTFISLKKCCSEEL